MLRPMALLICLLSAGCGKSHGWGVSGNPESHCWVEQLRCDGRVFAVLVANANSKGMSAGEGNGSFKGTLLAMDGRKIAWSCSTSDAEKGSLTIDGQRYDLVEGNVFLVQLAGSKVEVQQFAVEQAKLQAISGGQVRALEEAEPRIAAFVSEGKP
jgi:hypothetical protein